MKYATAIIICAFIISKNCFAGNYPQMWGSISPKEWSLERVEFDPEAEAVYLYDKGHSYFVDDERNGGYNIRFKEQKRIKVLKEGGKSAGEFTIYLYRESVTEREKLINIEAVCYNNDNGVITKTELAKSDVFEQEHSENRIAIRFAIPAIKVGSIFELRFEIESPYPSQLRDWYFQGNFPRIYSEYRVDLIPFYEYNFVGQRIGYFDVQKQYNDNVKRSWGRVVTNYGQGVNEGFHFYDVINIFGKKNIPAFKDETYITSVEDYIMKIDFQLSKIHFPNGNEKEIISTWERLIEEIGDYDGFGKYLNSSSSVAKKILKNELQIEGLSELQKVKTIINYVKEKFDWNGNLRRYAYEKPKDVYENRTGNGTELNLLLTAILQKAGIKAYPVLLSTRSHGKVKTEVPFLQAFNHSICYVELADSQSFLADATSELLPYNKIPPFCFNDKGLVVNEEEVIWVDLNDKTISEQRYVFNYDLSGQELNSLNLTIQSLEFEAYTFKENYLNDENEIKEYLSDKGFEEIQNIKTLNFDKNNAPYIVSVKGKSGIVRIENEIFVKPFLEFPIKTNPFVYKSRNYPIDMNFAFSNLFEARIKIPEGMKLKTLPSEIHANDRLAHIELKYELGEENVRVYGSYKFKKAVYEVDEYLILKAHIDRIVKGFNNELIFVQVLNE